jgi:hypothetical protein
MRDSMWDRDYRPSSLGEACHDATSIVMMISTVVGGGVFVLREGGVWR